MSGLAQAALEAIPGVDPRPVQRSQFFSGLNDGPAQTASRIAGLVSKSEAQDNSPYYTSNFGQLMPDSGHPLNVGGIPYQGDALLLEKQQAFDRSKLQERIVHPCGWGAFGESIESVMIHHHTHLSPSCIPPKQKIGPCHRSYLPRLPFQPLSFLRSL